MDELQFHSCYDSFPVPLLLRTASGWLTNPAADDLCLSQTDLEQLAAWDGNSSLWIAGQFFYVQGHRTADGLFLLLHTDPFMETTALKLSGQLRQRVSLAFTGLFALNDHLDGRDDNVNEDLSALTRALFQIFRIVTELDRCAAAELSCEKVCLDLTAWLRRLTDEAKQWCAPAKGVDLHVDLPRASISTMADPNLLDCMVTHLLSNAIKAAPDGKVEITLSLKKQGNQAVITLRSNTQIFSPSALTDPTWNQAINLHPGRGLGLGLPIAQRIAALHDGTLMVTPSKEGSQVVFSLPLSVPDGYLASPAPRVEPTGGFSMVRVILSDALPSAAFHPDFHPENKGK